MAITTPDAIPGEVIEAAWGDAVRTDLTAHETALGTKVAKAGDTMNGPLLLPSTQSTNGAAAVHHTYVNNNFVNKAGDVMTGNLQAPNLLTGGNLTMSGDSAILQMTGATTPRMYVGKNTSGIALAGTEIHSTTIWMTTGAASQINLQLQHNGSSSAHGESYQRFRTEGQGLLGSITQVNLTGVAYNQTPSDERLKSISGEVDPQVLLAKVDSIRLVDFTWTKYPELGAQYGFVAQQLAEVVPDAVTPGKGEPDDEDYEPWMTADSRLITTLVGAIQGLLRRVEALETKMAATT